MVKIFNSYEEARDGFNRFMEPQDFHDMKKANGVDVYAWQAREYLLEEESQAVGTNLSCYVLRIGEKTAKRKVMISSGVHGLEGFIGSSIQQEIIEHHLAKFTREDTALIFVHAVNPYGFYHRIRNNENNVDLNRNVRDHRQPCAPTDLFEEVHAALKYDEAGENFEDFKKRYQKIKKEYIAQHGYEPWKRTLIAGQYKYQDGMLYGGAAEQEQITMLRDIVSDFCATAEDMVFIDLHSGLSGGYGDVAPLLNATMNKSDFDRACDWWGEEMKIFADSYTGDQNLDGEVANVFDRNNYTTFTSITLEACVGDLDVAIDHLVELNWMYQADKAGAEGAYTNQEMTDLKAALLSRYSPPDQEWYDTVFNNVMPYIEEPFKRWAQADLKAQQKPAFKKLEP